MGEAKPPCATCGNQPVDVDGCMAHLDCKLAGQCQVEEGGPYRYYVERSKDKVFTPPLKLAVLYQVPHPELTEGGLPNVDLEVRMQEVHTLEELKEIERQVERARNPTNEEFEKLQNTEHPVRFVIPVDRQILMHIMQQVGLLIGLKPST